jgi:hypothetical protein
LPFNAIKQLLRAHESLSMYQEMTTGTWAPLDESSSYEGNKSAV